jgi:uncharacterized protein YbjT (DUF2867 family)
MNSNQSLKVLVYGATGSQAKPTVRHLLANGHHPYVLTRSQEKATDLESQGAKVVIGELADRDSLMSASEGMDGIAFLLPAFLDQPENAVQFGINAIDAAIAAGVETFIWNASGKIPRENSPSNHKLAIFRYLQASQLNYVLLEPTTYMENWLGVWTAPSVRQHSRLSYPVLENRKMGWIACDDVGALVVASLNCEAQTRDRFRISGIESPTGPELADIFSRALRRKIDYYAMTPEEMGTCLDSEFGAGAGDRVAEMYRIEQNDPSPEPNYVDMSPVLDALPIEMTRIETWVTEHSDKFG